MSELPSATEQLVVSACGPAQRRCLFSVVVPTYNERDNLPILTEQLANGLDGQYAGQYEIVVVDDNSPDGTADVVLALGQKYPQLHLVRRLSERGLGTAVVRGWQQASGQILVVMDADLQHPPSLIAELIKSVLAGNDVAIASRYTASGSTGQWGLLRRSLSKGATFLGWAILPDVLWRVGDPMSGCFAFRRQVIEGIELKPRGYKILVEVLARGRISSVSEVAYEFQTRVHGVTKASWRQFVEYMMQLMELRMYCWSHRGNRHDNSGC